jgi:anti-anti-sigma regulatory factor
MIVYTRGDVVRLSGSLMKNQWLTIKAAANLLLQDHPQGIIIDCAELGHVSEDGAMTFLDAMKDITAAGSRIVVVNLPDAVLNELKSIPGIRSQLPISSSIEEARASLDLMSDNQANSSSRAGMENPIIIPLIKGFDTEFSLLIAERIAKDTKQKVILIYLMEVARTLPLGAPLPEQEKAANEALNDAGKMAAKSNLTVGRYVERVRHMEEGLLNVLQHYDASYVLVSLNTTIMVDDPILTLVNLLIQRAPCNLIIGKRKHEENVKI